VPFLPVAYQGKPIVVIACCYTGPADGGEKATRELRGAPGAIVDQVGPMPYLAPPSAFDALNPAGLRNYGKSTFLESLPSAAIDAVVDRFGRVPSPMTEIHFQCGGGAIAKVPGSQSVIGNRRAHYLFNLVGKWTHPGADAANIAYIRDLRDALQPFSTGGVYSNFNTHLDQKSSESSFGKPNLKRRARLKRQFDPDNVFAGNHRILPAPK
jgi:hypothetical protein